MMWLRTLRLLVLALPVALAGCSGEAPPAATTPQAEIVWPAPPLKPRIRFLRTVSTPADAGIRRGWFQGFLRFVEGRRERRLSSPYGVARDPEGRLYVVDTFHKAVEVFDVPGSDHYWFPSESIDGFVNPVGIAVGADGRVYVSDSHSNVIHVFADHGKTYLRAMGRDVLRRPTGLALDDRSGTLYVADTLASQIVVFDTATLRAFRFVGRDGRGPKAFHYPTAVALAPDGTVYVTDSLNFRIQVLAPDLSFVRSFGKAGDSPGHFSRPKGVAVDSDGHVYVVDALFDNVQIFDRDGRLLLAFGSPGAKPGEFWLPNEIFIDEADRIYVSDSYNQRIQVFQYLKEGGGR